MMAEKMQPSVDFVEGIRGSVRFDEPMSRHTSWRVGGVADYFFTPADEADLIQMMAQAPADMPLHWVGLGSNLLVRDGGVRGMVICTSKGLDQLDVSSQGELTAQAGVSCAKISRFTVRNGYTGAEFLAGVPGTFGGALAMNAGAFGGETWQRVKQIRCCDRRGNVFEYDANDIEWGYRRVKLPIDGGILSATLTLELNEDIEGGRSKIKSLLAKRGASQPIQSASAGSVFRNPEGDHAARLIETCGLKGAVIGDAEYSAKHANFIVNRGDASSADIEQLILLGQQTVRDQFGVELEPEVRVIGETL